MSCLSLARCEAGLLSIHGIRNLLPSTLSSLYLVIGYRVPPSYSDLQELLHRAKYKLQPASTNSSSSLQSSAMGDLRETATKRLLQEVGIGTLLVL